LTSRKEPGYCNDSLVFSGDARLTSQFKNLVYVHCYESRSKNARQLGSLIYIFYKYRGNTINVGRGVGSAAVALAAASALAAKKEEPKNDEKKDE
jgi:hypothetical protein